MTALSVQPPFPIITGFDGQPLEDGYIWIGVANLSPIPNPIAVYWDAGLTIPAPLPIRTRGGYPVNSGTPARLYVGDNYSIQVQDKNGSVVYTALNSNESLTSLITLVIDDIVALRAVTWPYGRPSLVTLISNHTTGDGGGVFRWDSVSTATDDNGIVIKETAVATGRWIRQYTGPVLFPWYGSNQAAFVAALAASSTYGITFDGQGFSVPISSSLTMPANSFELSGAGINRSNITRSGAGGIPFAFGPQHSGSKLDGLSVTADLGSSGGSALSIVATAGSAPSKFAFDNLYLTTLQTDGWANTIVLDGSLRTASPDGIREAMFTNVTVFGSANWSFDGSGLRSVYGFGLNLFPAGGTITTPSATESGGLRLTGPVGMPSDGCFIKGSDVGRISLDRVIDCTVWFDSIAYDAAITANAQNALIIGKVYGTPSCASDTSGIVQPIDFARNWTDSSGWIGLPGGGMIQWVDVAVGTGFTSFSWAKTFAARPAVFGGNGRSGSYTAIVFNPTLATAVTTTGGEVATQVACDARIWAIGRTW